MDWHAETSPVWVDSLGGWRLVCPLCGRAIGFTTDRAEVARLRRELGAHLTADHAPLDARAVVREAEIIVSEHQYR